MFLSGREVVYLSPFPDVAEYYARLSKRSLLNANHTIGVVQISMPACVLQSVAELVGERWTKVRTGASDSGRRRIMRAPVAVGCVPLSKGNETPTGVQ